MGVKECPEILYSTTEKKQQQTNKQKKAGLKFIREVVKAFGNLKFCFCIATKSYRKFYWIINQRRPSWTLESEWPVWVWLLRKNKGVRSEKTLPDSSIAVVPHACNILLHSQWQGDHDPRRQSPSNRVSESRTTNKRYGLSFTPHHLKREIRNLRLFTEREKRSH